MQNVLNEQRWHALAEWAEHIAQGDRRGLDEFWVGVFEEVEAWIRQPDFLGGVAVRRDCVEDIVLSTWERLQADDFRRVRRFFTHVSEKVKIVPPEEALRYKVEYFRNWLHLVTRTVAIDYQRSLPEYIRNPSNPNSDEEDSDNDAKYWRSIVSLTSRKLIAHDPITLRLRAVECLDFLEKWIPEIEREAVARRDAGADWKEIQTLLGVKSQKEATNRVVRTREHMKYRPAIELWSQGFDYEDIVQRLELTEPSEAERLIRAAKRILRHHFREKA